MIRIAAFILCLLAEITFAAAPVECRVNTADLRLRKHSPIPLEVDLRNTTNSLLEGHLEVIMLHRDRRAGIHRSAPVVLSPGTRTVPPPCSWGIFRGKRTWHALYRVTGQRATAWLWT